MDGENKEKPYEQMDDLGGKTPPIFGNTQLANRLYIGCGPIVTVDHQDDITFFRIGNPNLNLHLPLLL